MRLNSYATSTLVYGIPRKRGRSGGCLGLAGQSGKGPVLPAMLR